MPNRCLEESRLTSRFRLDNGLLIDVPANSPPDHILREYVRFHNQHRPHQGLGNRTLRAALGNDPPPDHSESSPIHCKRFLGGLLRHYYRAAA
jgi:hypothetical protein